MAYDQSSYQAPRRAYYDQHQQAPVQRHNGGYPPQQQYDNYDQSYNQGYAYSQPQHGGYDDYGYDVNQQSDQYQQSGQYYGDASAGNGYGHDQYAQGQQEYRQGGHPQQQSNGYGRSNEGYANGHQANYDSRQYEHREQQRPGRGGHPPQANGHGHAQEGFAERQYNGNSSQDRQYDPRYQQRPSRTEQSSSDGPRSHRPPPISTNHQNYKGQSARPQDRDARNGHPESVPGQRHEQDSRNGYDDRRPVQDVRDRSEKRPPPSQSNGGSRQPPPPVQDPKKSAMEEWKAKEKAKMHEAANQPKIIPQDNAFPTFGVVKKDEKGHESKSSRSSEEQGRPSTSSGRSGSRPGSSKSNNQHQMSPPSATNGQSQHQQHSTRAPQPFSPIHEQPLQEHSSRHAQERGDYGRDQSVRAREQSSNQPYSQPAMHNNSGSRGYDAPNPPNDGRMPPRTSSAQGQQSVGRKPLPANQRTVPPAQSQAQYVQPQAPHSNVEPARPFPVEQQPESTDNTQSDEYYPQESWRTGPPRKRPQANPAPKSEATPPSLQEPYRTGSSTARSQDLPVAQQPQPPPPIAKAVTLPSISPPPVAPPFSHQAPPRSFSPATQQPRSDAQAGHVPARNFARPNVAPAVQPQEHNLDDFYDDYYGEEASAPASVPAPPRNRDEEIEAEMPDFDSAAPGQTSGVEKRQAPRPTQAMPPQHVNTSVQSLPVRGNQPYENYQQPAIASQPDLRDVRHDQGGTTSGFVFGVPGERIQPQQQYDDYRQRQPPQQPMGYRPVQSVPPENMRRFQPPAGHQQMNMPIRNGPPGQHPQAQQYAPDSRGPMPPLQRSESARPPIAQAGWSDPGMQGMQRAPTAPPMRQDSYGMPRPGMPRADTLPNQQFRAPSAPPGQQHMRGMPPPGAPRNGPPYQQQSARPSMQEQRPSDPDSLPHHPAPYRPGLMEQGAPQPPKPAPVRSYDNRSSTSSHQRQASNPDKPITKADLDQARLDMEASPASPRLALRYAKKLVEASHILASEGGRLDAKATQRNRERYLNEAYKKIKDLVRNTYPEAQFYMAECYGSGELGLQVDPKEAFTLYQAAAKGGHAAAAFRTAVSCEIGPEEGGGTRKDYPKAVQWYRRAAALGDVAAMYKLGIILLRAMLGVPRNVGEAVSWLKRAAERADTDNPHALHELATLHDPANVDPQVREKVIPDESYSLSLFKQAADYGFKRSQFRLGQAYEYGSLGLEIDNRASIAWYTKAAAQGEHNAELALSGWYLTGAEGMLEQSDMEAYLWARKAAQAEPPLAKAMFAMGYFTEQGIGCPKSLEEAKRWYGRAASFQFPRALERLEELRKGGKNKSIQNGKLTRDKKKDDENCVVM